jgi:ubiquinone/menaquinone biosynthesis C-methylase UbiE
MTDSINTSSASDVRNLYDSSVESYAQMMEAEIELPIYAEILTRLEKRIASLEGPLLDSSCGTGHLIELYGQHCNATRQLIGVDLSPAMAAHAQNRLGNRAKIEVGDMRNLSAIAPASLAAMLSFFAVHHLGQAEIPPTLKEWAKAMTLGGQLVVAAWEGTGPIDYGDSSDVIALRYTKEELTGGFEAAGFHVDRCWVEDVEGFDMKALYLEGTRV